MKILFLTIARILDVEQRELYQDLMREFRDQGHELYIVSPRERRYHESTTYESVSGVHMLGVKTLNQQKTNVLEKGMGTILLEHQFRNAIKKYLKGVQFDLILYSTPPITFPNVISYLRSSNPQAKTYLLLKDIFPQNAIDLGMMSKSGAKGLLYKYFRKKEKKLYALSDYIGCMSPANVDYLLKNNPEVAAYRVEVAPNTIDPIHNVNLNKNTVREKYGLPTGKPVFIYGGNLGKPQGIPFLIQCLDANKHRADCFFVIVGDGVYYEMLNTWYKTQHPLNVAIIKRLPKEEFELLTGVCDVGMIFLDHRFTIPNYPSRSLSYMANKLPLLVVTDSNSDMGPIAEQNGFGLWCESNAVDNFNQTLDKMLASDISSMGEKAYEFLCQNYLVSNTYNVIMKHFGYGHTM